MTAPIILWMWLATSPNIMIPTSHHFGRTAQEDCITARKREVYANVAAGMGGGAAYVCAPYDKEK